MPVVPLEYVEVDDRGIAKLVGSRIKVMHLVMAQMGEGYTAEQLCDQYPHLSPAQVYAALAYYHAHKAEVDAHIRDDIRYSEAMRAEHAAGQPTRQELERRLADRQRSAS